jgi:hypothetical protein
MSNITDSSVYSIPKDGYVAFDALSLRQLIVSRLNEQKVFTDQNFIGSNLASIIDIVAYSFHTLIYYLNKTSTESMFTESQLYENMNRIVKLLDYNPIGFQTSTLSISVSVSNLPQGIYAIPRYTTVNMNGIAYSFNEDISVVKTVSGVTEQLTELSRLKLLFQGQYQEYPQYVATGEGNEILIINTADSKVDHFNIDVYVKSIQTGLWKQYHKTTNLYLEDGSAEKFEIRYNSNKRYEIKFGNDINGKSLKEDDIVAVYYLVSNGDSGVVGEEFTTSELRRYNTPQYDSIISDVNNEKLTYLVSNQLPSFSIKNAASSTLPKEPETVDSIRQLAPAVYRSQYRLVTVNDYEVFVKANFTNLISDVKAVNNWSYASGYMKYFYDIGINAPYATDRALLNQVLYADSCNFNNVYLIIVPRATVNNNYNYLTPAQKELISSSMLSTKMATTETTFIDPVYKAVSFGVQTTSADITSVDGDVCKLVIRKSPNVRVNDDMIVNDIVEFIKSYFNRVDTRLGQTINLRDINQGIRDIPGVGAVKTVRDDTGESVDGVSFLIWNPSYPESDLHITRNDVAMQYFEYPYFYDLENLHTRIQVNSSFGSFEQVEY